MRYLLIILWASILISCNRKNNKIYIVEHSPSDTCWIEETKNLYLVTWLKDSLPYKCGTEIQIILKDTTKYDELKFTVNGAEFLKNKISGKYLFYPINNKVELKIDEPDNIEFEKQFHVFKLPIPEMQIYIDGSKIKDEISINSKLLSVKFSQPNEKLKRIYPMDCRYGFERVKIKLEQFDMTLLMNEQVTDTLNIKPLLEYANEHDKLQIETDSIFRLNFRNEKVYLDSLDKKFETEIKKNSG